MQDRRLVENLTFCTTDHNAYESELGRGSSVLLFKIVYEAVLG